MVLPAIPIAAMAIIRLIAWLSSAVLISSYVRDIITKEPGQEVEISQDDTIETILNNSDLTPEQKEKTVLEYLNLNTSDSGIEDLKKYIPMAIVGYVFVKIIGGK